MSKIRIIPCLDMLEDRVVSGKKFDNMLDINSPKALVRYYYESGADELIFYDIRASIENRKTNLEYIKSAMTGISIPFCVGGGIASTEDIENCLNIGAYKISINTAAIKNPKFIKNAAIIFGSEKIVLAVDAKKVRNNTWNVFTGGGKQDTGLNAIEWVNEGVRLGAGEVIINSIDEDGMRGGYDIELLKTIKETINVPIIASGGAGRLRDFYDAIAIAKVDGVLAASIFHSAEIKIAELMGYLADKGVSIN